MFGTNTSDVYDYHTITSSDLSIQYARTSYRKFVLRCLGPEMWHLIPFNIRDQITIYNSKLAWK